MAQLIAIARLVAAMLGTDFDQEWACYTANPSYTPKEPYAMACEYDSYAYNVLVWRNWDEGDTYIKISPYRPR